MWAENYRIIDGHQSFFGICSVIFMGISRFRNRIACGDMLGWWPWLYWWLLDDFVENSYLHQQHYVNFIRFPILKIIPKMIKLSLYWCESSFKADKWQTQRRRVSYGPRLMELAGDESSTHDYVRHIKFINRNVFVIH